MEENNLEIFKQVPDDYDSQLIDYKNKMTTAYNNFLIALEAALKAKEVPLE